MFFSLEMSICERFPCLSPFDIRMMHAHEVFLLIDRLNNYTRKERKQKTQQIRRPAGDNWF